MKNDLPPACDFKISLMINCESTWPGLNGCTSHSIPVTLGPVLFTKPSIVSSPVFMFFDDTKIFCAIRSIKDYFARPFCSYHLIPELYNN